MENFESFLPSIVVWRIFAGLAVGVYAHSKDFRFWWYFFFGAIGGPFLALITLSMARKRLALRPSETTSEN